MVELQQCAVPPAKVLPGHAENRERRPQNETGLIFAACSISTSVFSLDIISNQRIDREALLRH